MLAILRRLFRRGPRRFTLIYSDTPAPGASGHLSVRATDEAGIAGELPDAPDLAPIRRWAGSARPGQYLVGRRAVLICHAAGLGRVVVPHAAGWGIGLLADAPAA